MDVQAAVDNALSTLEDALYIVIMDAVLRMKPKQIASEPTARGVSTKTGKSSRWMHQVVSSILAGRSVHGA